LSDISEFDSSTTTADELIPENNDELVSPIKTDIKRLDENRDDIIGEIKKSEITSLLEYEATQALMTLAGITPSPINGNDNFSQESEAFPRPGEDSIVFEHSYCLPMVTNESEKSSEVSKPQKAKKVAQDKRKRKNEVTAADENIFAVASEWRKAKRKIGEMNTLIIKENDENKLLDQKIEEPKITFPKREVHAEMEVLYEFLHNGIDAEDIGYLKRSYDRLLQEETDLRWINDIHWVDHPPTTVPTPKKKRRFEDSCSRVHKTDCARTEGYYKMESHEKIKYSHVAANSGGTESDKITRARQLTTTQQLTREARSNQRRLLATVDSALTDLLKFNQLKVRLIFE